MSYLLTLVASHPDNPVSHHHITQIKEQSAAPVWLSPDKAVDISIPNKPGKSFMDALRTQLAPDKIDVFINPREERRKKLLLADMDSTIVTGETLDDLADFAGLKDKIAAITAKAMNGELDFETALLKRVSLLKGLPVEALEKTLSETQISPGAQTLVRTMRKHGAVCILVSGGFTFFTKAIANEIGFDAHHGNILEINNHTLTGKVIPPILDKQAKVGLLQKYANNIKLANAIAIGDGANDIPMLELAGFGVGYRPKDIVAQAIQNIIVYGDLSAALYAQGYTDQDLEKK